MMPCKHGVGASSGRRNLNLCSKCVKKRKSSIRASCSPRHFRRPARKLNGEFCITITLILALKKINIITTRWYDGTDGNHMTVNDDINNNNQGSLGSRREAFLSQNISTCMCSVTFNPAFHQNSKVFSYNLALPLIYWSSLWFTGGQHRTDHWP